MSFYSFPFLGNAVSNSSTDLFNRPSKIATHFFLYMFIYIKRKMIIFHDEERISVLIKKVDLIFFD